MLHGLCPAALLRYCEEFHAQFGHLAEQDSRRYLDEGIRVVTQHVRFCQPAIHAALELGVESFWEVVDTLLASSVLDFEVNLQRLAPAADQGQLQRCGRAIRHSICAALLDKSMSPDELGETLHILVDSYVNRMQVAPPVHRSLAA